jgi:hypothetical protein
VITIETGAVLVGELPSRALKLVSEWAKMQPRGAGGELESSEGWR